MMCNIFYSSEHDSTPLEFQSLTDVQVSVNKTLHRTSIDMQGFQIAKYGELIYYAF